MASAQDIADCLTLNGGDDDYAASASTQLYLVLMGALVFFMQAGFSLLEAGSTGNTAVTSILFKNMADVVIGAIAWWATGYAFAYGSDKMFVGTEKFFMEGMGRCEYSSWFFQWTFAATAVTIVSGAMAGRTQLFAYLAYAVTLTAFIYPAIVHWTWSSKGWLLTGNENSDGIGYVDFAGSGIVHCTGGMAALVGCWMVGPRGTDLFEFEDKADIPGHSMPLVQLGTMILFFGFLGFNGGSVLALDSATDAAIMSLAIVNTVMAAAGGGMAAELFNWIIVKRKYWSLMQMCNGVIAGMVAICASANNVYPWAALVIGFIGGIAYKLWSIMLMRLRIDDAIDAVGVHLGAGLWGVIAAAFFDNPSAGAGGMSIFFDDNTSGLVGKQLGWSLCGLAVICSWTGATTFVLFFLLKRFGRLRVSDTTINKGLDLVEHSESAYVFSIAPNQSHDAVKRGSVSFNPSFNADASFNNANPSFKE